MLIINRWFIVWIIKQRWNPGGIERCANRCTSCKNSRFTFGKSSELIFVCFRLSNEVRWFPSGKLFLQPTQALHMHTKKKTFVSPPLYMLFPRRWASYASELNDAQNWMFPTFFFPSLSAFFDDLVFVAAPIGICTIQRQGCIHGEDLPYIFGAPLIGGFNHFPRNYTKSEISLSEAVMLYWSNFVRSGCVIVWNWVDFQSRIFINFSNMFIR